MPVLPAGGVGAAELGEQELTDQGVEAVARRSPGVPGGDEGVGAQHLTEEHDRVGAVEAHDGVLIELGEDGEVEREAAEVLREPVEHLRHEVVGEEPVGREDVLQADGVVGAAIEEDPGQEQAHRPALGPVGELCNADGIQVDAVEPFEQGLRFIRAERQVGLPQLRHQALGAPPADGQDGVGAAGRHQTEPTGRALDQERQLLAHRGVVHDVQVVEHEDHGRGLRQQRLQQRGDDRGTRGTVVEEERLDLAGRGTHGGDRRDHVAPQRQGVPVQGVQGHPGEAVGIGAGGPARDGRGLAVAGRRRDEHDRAAVLDRIGDAPTGHEVLRHLERAELAGDEGDRGRAAILAGHSANLPSSDGGVRPPHDRPESDPVLSRPYRRSDEGQGQR